MIITKPGKYRTLVAQKTDNSLGKMPVGVILHITEVNVENQTVSGPGFSECHWDLPMEEVKVK